MKKYGYPAMRYHPEKDPVIVQSEDDDLALGSAWVDSPAKYGVETCPAAKPCPIIAANKEKYEAAQKPKKERKKAQE